MKSIKKLTGIILVVAISLLSLPAHAREANFRAAIGELVATSPGPERSVTTEEGSLELYSASGKLMPGFPVTIENQIFTSSPIIGNFTGSGPKKIAVFMRDEAGAYYHVLIDGNGVIIGKISPANGAEIYYDPVVLKVTSVRDNFLYTNGKGQIMEVSEGGTKSREIFAVAVPSAVNANFAGTQLFIVSPQEATLKRAVKQSDIWTIDKIVDLNKPIIYPTLVESSKLIYGITSEGKLIAIEIETGNVKTGFPVSFDYMPVRDPIFSEIESNNPGKEIVVLLNDGSRAVVDKSGNILTYLRKKSFHKTYADTEDPTGGVFSPSGEEAVSLTNRMTETTTSLLSRIKFDTSGYKEPPLVAWNGTFHGTKLENNQLTVDSSFPYYKFDESLWAGAGKEVIDSLGEKDATPTGGVQNSVPGKHGRAAEFDGVNDAISTPVLYSGTTDLTLAAWYKTDNTTTQRMAVIGGNNGGRFEIYIHQGVPGCRVWDTKERFVFADSKYVGDWHHVACVQTQGANPKTKLYVDGKFKKEINFASVSKGGLWYIGRSGSTIGKYFQGIIDEAAIIPKALTDSEIEHLVQFPLSNYESEIFDRGEPVNWTRLEIFPFAPYGKELLSDQRVETDYSENNMDMTGNVALLHLDESSCSGVNCPMSSDGKFKTALLFDGNDYLTIPTNTTLELVDNFTAMGWIKRNKRYGWDGFFGKAKYDKGKWGGWSVNYDALSNKFAAFIACNGNYEVIKSDAVADFLWHHIALKVENGKASLFIDGVEQTQTSTKQICDSGKDFIIGRYYADYPDHYLEGKVDEVAIFNRALSNADIASAYKRGTAKVRYQVRSCDDTNCEGEIFVGPDGTNASFYSELDNNTMDIPLFDLILPLNRYFQYRIELEREKGQELPRISSVSYESSE